MKVDHPFVSIVIPCRNEEKYIKACLLSVLRSNYPLEKFEVLVVDGKSEDATPAIVQTLMQDHLQLQLLENPQQTTPFALNIGLKQAKGEVKIILGAHAEVDENFIAENIAALSISKEIGCAGGVIENVYEDESSELIGKAMSSPFGVGNAHFRTAQKDGYVDTVAFGAYRQEVFEKIGYFDEELVRNQDDEFNYRLTKAGFKIYLSKRIRSKYYVRASLDKLFRQYFQYGYWKVFVNKKHQTVTTLRQLVPLFFVLYLWMGFFAIGQFLAVSSFYPILIYLAGLFLYALLAFYFALQKQTQLGKALKTIGVFYILHYSYGSGYLKGIWRFLILRKGPAENQMRSTR